MPILIMARMNLLPGKRASPRNIPAGMPIIVLIRTAVTETLIVSKVISSISRSPDMIISIAFFNPSSKSSISNQAFFQILSSKMRIYSKRKNNGSPYSSTPNSLMIFFVSSETIYSTNAFAPSAFTLSCFSLFTCIT